MSTYTLSEFAKLVGVSTQTLQRWDRAGILIADRTPTNRRRYTELHLAQVQRRLHKRKRRLIIAYCRVSRTEQKTDLDRQRQMIEHFCVARGLAIDEWIEEIGTGLNFKRRKFVSLIDRIIAGEIGTLVIAHQDRLVRVGFDLLSHLCEQANCELVVLNAPSLSPDSELREDLLALVEAWGARLDTGRAFRLALQRLLDGQGSNQASV
jgi:putative resolvase